VGAYIAQNRRIISNFAPIVPKNKPRKVKSAPTGQQLKQTLYLMFHQDFLAFTFIHPSTIVKLSHTDAQTSNPNVRMPVIGHTLYSARPDTPGY
jgi:hypothetical protein